MKNILIGLICFVAGGGVGYFIAKKQYAKKLDAAIESINETTESVNKKREKSQEKTVTSIDDSNTKKDEDDENGHVDVYTLSEEEEEESDDDEEDNELYYDDYDEKARVEFESKFSDYVGTGIPYPITQKTFDDHDGMHYKRRMIIYTEEDKAYNPDSGEEYENFHASIGDEDYDTLNEDNCVDFFGVWYIRNDHEGFDYEIEYGNRILEDR